MKGIVSQGHTIKTTLLRTIQELMVKFLYNSLNLLNRQRVALILTLNSLGMSSYLRGRVELGIRG